MKKILVWLTSASLVVTGVMPVVSCARGNKVVQKDNVDLENEVMQDAEVFNQIKTKISAKVAAWWENKTVVDIQQYPDLKAIFKLLNEKISDKELILKGNSEITQWDGLNLIWTGFKTEFQK